ncbi:MAG: chemotaxis protein CheD [Chloroflexota bacterium]|nr:chemotaxis protein CheD [Chloroflexota bacterium]
MGIEDKSIIVNLGEVRVSKDPKETLTCLGIGSCIAICMYDMERGLCGMAHVVLPESNGSGASTKYADVAVPQLIHDMRHRGGHISRLTAKIAGGAQMATVGGGGDIGNKNSIAVTENLAQNGIKIVSSDVGGHRGRSVTMPVAQCGKVFVKTIGEQPREL